MMERTVLTYSHKVASSRNPSRSDAAQPVRYKETSHRKVRNSVRAGPPSRNRTAVNCIPRPIRSNLSAVSQMAPKVDGGAFDHSVITFAEIVQGPGRLGVRSAGSHAVEKARTS